MCINGHTNKNLFETLSFGRKLENQSIALISYKLNKATHSLVNKFLVDKILPPTCKINTSQRGKFNLNLVALLGRDDSVPSFEHKGF